VAKYKQYDVKKLLNSSVVLSWWGRDACG